MTRNFKSIGKIETKYGNSIFFLRENIGIRLPRSQGFRRKKIGWVFWKITFWVDSEWIIY